jgi:hypothetical protein
MYKRVDIFMYRTLIFEPVVWRLVIKKVLVEEGDI